MARSAADRERERQTRSNRNSLPSYEHFAGHRERLTRVILERGAAAAGGRLCILGAGNCHDLELERLTAHYREVHLVDLDAGAIEQARAQQPESVRERLVLHPSLDLSQMLGELERYRKLQVSAARLAEQPNRATQRIAGQLGGPFESVVSACVLSQMQLALRTELGDAHPLLAALGYTLSATHLRTLAALTVPGGSALLASDVADERLASLDTLPEGTNLLEHLARLVLAGEVFHFVDPVLLSQMCIDDPTLARELRQQPLEDVWVWRLTAQRSYLVYALLLQRQAEPRPAGPA